MLNAVPNAVRKASRVATLRHPNAFDGQLMRRVVKRTEGAEAGEAGGLPTLGGLAVMDPEDEPEVDYELMGDVRVLFTDQYQGTTMADRGDAPESMGTAMAMIEPLEEGQFAPKDGDLVMLMPGAGVVIPYEVTNVINAINIPPYVAKYELSAQGDLVFAAGLER